MWRKNQSFSWGITRKVKQHDNGVGQHGEAWGGAMGCAIWVVEGGARGPPLSEHIDEKERSEEEEGVQVMSGIS